MPDSNKNMIGQVYRCPVCGSELSIIRIGAGQLSPVCCNTEMKRLETINKIYRCYVCGSELMVIKGGENLEPVCCNKRMIESQ